MIRREQTADRARIKRAAEYVGLSWQLIASRPKTALQFCRRVENEMRAKGELA